MAFSTINKSSDYFNTVLYTGNATARSITGVGFQPDLLWIKDGTNSNSHQLADAVRGATKVIVSDENYTETTDSNRISAFDSDGFSIGTNNNVNQSSANDVSWNWKANGSGSANTVGSVNSTVSVNATAGFSIVKFSAPSSGTFDVGHGLGVAPKCILMKRLNVSQNWICYWNILGSNKFIQLNTTNPENTNADMWQNTHPTSALFYSDVSQIGASGDYIAYCFSEISGYSKFGSYPGNGNADGAFIYTGFKPSLIIIKGTNTSYAENWFIFDNKRPGYNFNANLLNPNSATTETTTGANGIDILSNGFKMRSTDNGTNRSTDTYIYAAFGQPIISNSGVCATAR